MKVNQIDYNLSHLLHHPIIGNIIVYLIGGDGVNV